MLSGSLSEVAVVPVPGVRRWLRSTGVNCAAMAPTASRSRASGTLRIVGAEWPTR
jgi:hypothetical protein